MFDPTNLDPSDAILLSMPNGDLSVGGTGFGAEEETDGYMSQEQVSASMSLTFGAS